MSVAGHDSIGLGGDLRVRRLGFGALRITVPGCKGPPEDREGARRLLRRVVELGINLIDTADSYGPEVSENLIAEALHPYPEDLVIATKGGLRGPRPHDARPERLRECCEASLRRLRLERIDLYQLHAPDPEVPLEESIGALAALRSEGKIRHIGISNVSLEDLDRARGVADIVSVQNRYSAAERMGEDVLAACEGAGIAFLPWFPLLDGGLASAEGPLELVARRHNATPSQVAIAWLLRRSPIMVPIPGTGRIDHLEENAAAAELTLSDEDVRMIDEAA
jgi:aryl-alcohol dehydrogenase-like predicted oxidoreductase